MFIWKEKRSMERGRIKINFYNYTPSGGGGTIKQPLDPSVLMKTTSSTSGWVQQSYEAIKETLIGSTAVPKIEAEYEKRLKLFSYRYVKRFIPEFDINDVQNFNLSEYVRGKGGSNENFIKVFLKYDKVSKKSLPKCHPDILYQILENSVDHLKHQQSQLLTIVRSYTGVLQNIEHHTQQEKVGSTMAFTFIFGSLLAMAVTAASGGTAAPFIIAGGGLGGTKLLGNYVQDHQEEIKKLEALKVQMEEIGNRITDEILQGNYDELFNYYELYLGTSTAGTSSTYVMDPTIVWQGLPNAVLHSYYDIVNKYPEDYDWFVQNADRGGVLYYGSYNAHQGTGKYVSVVQIPKLDQETQSKAIERKVRFVRDVKHVKSNMLTLGQGTQGYIGQGEESVQGSLVLAANASPADRQLVTDPSAAHLVTQKFFDKEIINVQDLSNELERTEEEIRPGELVTINVPVLLNSEITGVVQKVDMEKCNELGFSAQECQLRTWCENENVECEFKEPNLQVANESYYLLDSLKLYATGDDKKDEEAWTEWQELNGALVSASITDKIKEQFQQRRQLCKAAGCKDNISMYSDVTPLGQQYRKEARQKFGSINTNIEFKPSKAYEQRKLTEDEIRAADNAVLLSKALGSTFDVLLSTSSDSLVSISNLHNWLRTRVGLTGGILLPTLILIALYRYRNTLLDTYKRLRHGRQPTPKSYLSYIQINHNGTMEHASKENVDLLVEAVPIRSLYEIKFTMQALRNGKKVYFPKTAIDKMLRVLHDTLSMDAMPPVQYFPNAHTVNAIKMSVDNFSTSENIAELGRTITRVLRNYRFMTERQRLIIKYSDDDNMTVSMLVPFDIIKESTVSPVKAIGKAPSKTKEKAQSKTKTNPLVKPLVKSSTKKKV